MLLDEKSEMFIVHTAALKSLLARITIYSSQTAWSANLQLNEALIKILLEYTDYADIFSLNLAIELLENTGINEHTIQLKDDK